MTHRILRPLPSAVYISGQKAHPAIVHRPSSTVYLAVCRPRSAVCIRLFVPHSLTVCIPGRLENLPYGGLSSAVCGLHSFIRSPIR